MTLQTEYAFRLPKGYVDESGSIHRDGIMRLATARDEIDPLRDVRVRDNEAYFTIVALGRVVTSLGSVPQVTTKVIENLFAADINFLQEFYEAINFGSDDDVELVTVGPLRDAVVEGAA